MHLDGWIAETLVYKAALSETDLDSVISYLNNKYFLSTSPPGDHNGDGKVNAADYALWRKDPTLHGNDQGYLDWRANFGDVAPAAGASIGGGNAVPEPTAAMLLITAVLASACCRRR